MSEVAPGAVSFGRRLTELAHERGSSTAVVSVARDGSSASIGWDELDRRSNQLARAIGKHGVAAGDLVGIRISNGIPHVVAAFATWKRGAVPVPMRWDLPAWELERVRAAFEPTLVLDADHAAWTTARSCPDGPCDDVVAPHGWGILSSGSTGTPKVILRLAPAVHAVGARSNPLIEAYGTLGAQTQVVPAPMYHTTGFLSITKMLCGDRVVVLESFDAGLLLDVIGRERATGMAVTTVMLHRLARHPGFERCDLSSLQWVMHGAAPLPDWLAMTWIERLGATRFFVCYGATESIGLTLARGDEYADHRGTVGRPVAGTALRILDAEGAALPPLQIGRVAMRSGDAPATSYLGEHPALVPEADGFVGVGDLGWVDDGGYLYLADRRQDVIITGGANVYPAEVEAALSEHPAVRDVVVIGLSDPDWGRRVHAVVVAGAPAPSSDELIAFAAARLARYKVPKSVELVTSLPRSEATKINRQALVDARERAEPDRTPVTDVP